MHTKIEFDVIVIGAGAGGLNIAGFMNKAGFKVLLVDKEDRTIGGDCLNFGCVPSKALIHVARQVRSSNATKRFGLSSSGSVDIKKVMEYVRDKQEVIRVHENAEHFRKQGMEVVLGTASFVDSATVEVAGIRYKGKKIVIATGSRPRKLDLPGSESLQIYDNENIFSIDFLPKRMVIVGAGPIGIELGQAFAALGTKVVVVGPKLLDKEDPEIVAPLQAQLEKDGMELLLGYKPTEVRDESILVVADDAGQSREIPFDILFASIGREVDFTDLDLNAAGIKTDDHGRLFVDEYLRTTNKNVLVCGDAAGGHQFTHAAELHASVIIANFFSPLKKKLNTDTMAWVTYTTPEIATFGLGEAQLKKRALSYEVRTQNFTDSDRAIVDEHTDGKLKVFVSPKGRILGGTMVSENAGEIAQELMLAQANGMTLDSLMKKVYPYPTASRVNRSLVLAYMAKKLTPRALTLLRILFH